MKAQSSIEYIILVGLILAALIPLVYYATTKSSNEIRINQADQTVQTIAKAADNVYTAGPGNREYIRVVLPSGINYFNITGRNVILSIGIYGAASQVHARSIATLTNTSILPNEQGVYNLIVRMTDKGVEIYKP